jgi:predicted transposase/invertase (TIGR01784 family)
MAVRYLDPRNDVVFKRIFGEHEGILRSFLNALLPLPDDGQIVSLEYLPAEQVPELPLFKNTIVDVRCKDQQGRQFIVEMQMNWTNAFLQRVLFNASKAYVRQLDRAERYEVLQPVIGLSLLDDVFRPETEQFYHHYQLAEENQPESVIEGIKLVFIELPKFKAEGWKRKLAVAWLRFLKETGDVDTQEEEQQLQREISSVAPEIQEAVTLSKEGAFSPGELEAYDRYWDAVRTERTLLEGKTAEAKAEGHAEGRAEGRAEGIEVGMAQGIEQGRLLERAAMLKKLMATGMTEAQARALLDA